MMLRLYVFSAKVYQEDISETEAYLRSYDAFMEPLEGKLKFSHGSCLILTSFFNSPDNPVTITKQDRSDAMALVRKKRLE